MQQQDANAYMVILTAISIVALFGGPVIAVQTDKFLSKINEKKRSRELIFKTLMATRGSTLSGEHVAALNKIELEFPNNKKYKAVLEAWKYYFDNLSDEQKRKASAEVWINDNNELLVVLLFEMGKSLGYSFDKASIKRNVYLPMGHAIIEQELQEIRQLLLSLLRGQSTLPMEISNVDESRSEQVALQIELWKLMIDYYKSEKALKAKLKNDNKPN